MMSLLGCVVVCIAIAVTLATDPLVTLSHGGQLQGKQFKYNSLLDVDLFLGVRYAAPPVGDLRFKRPVPVGSWTGVKKATHPGNACAQLDFLSQKVIGVEDCLFLDITVPGGVNASDRKAVMIFIHGGGYSAGTKDSYPGVALAVTGDVIVVTINYRLAMLGFLSEGQGTGNFGLWDQREAIMWVKKNIDKFGGDPDRITLFGESAGGASVSAQMMSPYNEGLFQRGIPESGPLYTDWGWYRSENQLYEQNKMIKEKRNCPLTQSVYTCLRQTSVNDLFALVPINLILDDWHPTADEDFFTANITEENYDLITRFDMLTGFNKDEGALFLVGYFYALNVSTPDGVSIDLAKKVLDIYCDLITPLSVKLCVDFLMDTYQLDTIANDQDRGIQLSYVIGEVTYNADSVRQLSQHSHGSKSTYAYYFTELYKTKYPGAPNLSWMGERADHADELPFVFGSVYWKELDLVDEYLGGQVSPAAQVGFEFLNGTNESDKPLSDLIMTFWSNFAKTGNPNLPVSLPSGTPTWPQFDTANNKFMELNSASSQVITTPEKERLLRLVQNLFKARTQQVNADKAPVHCQEDDRTTPKNLNVIG